MRVLFWVQNLLGVGHVVRAGALVKAMHDAGLAVTVANGGFDRPAAPDVRQLPPVRAADQTFSQLLGEHGPADEALWSARTRDLLALHDDVEPDLVLIEAWPFGRRPFTRELDALLARTGVKVAISVRDILHTGRKPGRAEETRERANRADLVLVHADPAVSRLADTYPLAHELTARVEHTGYVASAATVAPRGGVDVLVSAGGGAFGGPLMRAALASAALLPERRFTLATGRNLPAGTRRALAAEARPNALVTDHLEGLANHMAGARVSVSQAGYNSAVDLLRTQAFGTRAVLVPSDVDGQNEQATRATLLARAGRALVLPESRLTPDALARAIEAAPEPGATPVDMNGAARSAKLLLDLL